MPEQIDYTKFIATLKNNDQDGDGLLSLKEFTTVLKQNHVYKSDELSALLFNGVKEEGKNYINFNTTRAVFEALVHSKDSAKNFAVMVFCGADEDCDRMLNKSEYCRIIRIIKEEKISDEELDAQFMEITNNEELMTYPQAMKSIFNIKVNKNENPYACDISYRSPHSSCCLII